MAQGILVIFQKDENYLSRRLVAFMHNFSELCGRPVGKIG